MNKDKIAELLPFLQECYDYSIVSEEARKDGEVFVEKLLFTLSKLDGDDYQIMIQLLEDYKYIHESYESLSEWY